MEKDEWIASIDIKYRVNNARHSLQSKFSCEFSFLVKTLQEASFNFCHRICRIRRVPSINELNLTLDSMVVVFFLTLAQSLTLFLHTAQVYLSTAAVAVLLVVSNVACSKTQFNKLAKYLLQAVSLNWKLLSLKIRIMHLILSLEKHV
jgi:hypothetical protein